MLGIKFDNFWNPRGLCLVALLGLAPGCIIKPRITQPARSVGEELLLSAATERALSELDQEAIKRLSGFKVFLSETYLKALDGEYLVGSLRDLLIAGGVLLTDKMEEAQIIVEVRSGALSADSSTSTIGIPEDEALPNPVTGAAIALPALSLYKRMAYHSVAKVALVAYQKDSREHVFSSGTLLGGSYDKHVQFLGLLKLRFSNVPEIKQMKRLNRRRP